MFTGRTPGKNGGGGGAGSHIKVVVRVRPPNKQELAGAHKNVVQVLINPIVWHVRL